MIRLHQAVVVEGKYDKITLENVIDATIIVINGFRIFKDKEKCELIKTLSQKNGIIIMTDSDSAGAMLRSYLKKICNGGTIINVYIPQLKGKERRKSIAGKEQLLGVEGMTPDIIKSTLIRSGVDIYREYDNTRKKVDKTLLYNLGLSGGTNSSVLREQLSEHLNLPKGVSANAFLDAVNAVFDYDEFLNEVEIWKDSKR